MSVAQKIARSVLPQGFRRSLKRNLKSIYYSATSPFRTPFESELLRLEMKKRAKSLAGLSDFGGWDAEPGSSSAWFGLESLAYEMVMHYKPKVIVELGTHNGLSALAMGLALRDLGEGGQLFAIDCWEGDSHVGHYGEEIYQTFLGRVDKLGLQSNIVPLKMYFDQARDLVSKPIDILHIDGLHTWDAVSHDFETFAPLVKPGGLVMFHDVNNHFEGVRRFWDQVSKDCEHHLVPHSNGLGILRTKPN